MTISEESRHRLYLRLEEVLGPDEATVLMEHLPPVGWADVATKRDIEGLAVATKRDIEGLAVATRHDIEGLAVATRHDIDLLGTRMDARLERELRLMTWRVALAMLTLISVAVAAGRF